MNTLGPFARRRNRDRSVDSICTKCYRTVASADRENELIPHEQSHECDANEAFSRQPTEFQPRITVNRLRRTSMQTG